MRVSDKTVTDDESLITERSRFVELPRGLLAYVHPSRVIGQVKRADWSSRSSDQVTIGHHGWKLQQGRG
ncbi:hypothetical protein, partial [Plantactinospora sp. B5E13]|uniref:hypothetical protein n=1 Tax=Plantactinospora sp. B5E13 TaxID=3153758 RepID=UPI00325C5B1F